MVTMLCSKLIPHVLFIPPPLPLSPSMVQMDVQLLRVRLGRSFENNRKSKLVSFLLTIQMSPSGPDQINRPNELKFRSHNIGIFMFFSPTPTNHKNPHIRPPNLFYKISHVRKDSGWKLFTACGKRIQNALRSIFMTGIGGQRS